MNSKDLYDEAKNYLPGGVNSPVRSYKPYPFFAKHAKGSRIFDVDGNEYIDYCLAYGPLVLGHLNYKIIEKVKEQLELGTAFGVPTNDEIELSKLVIKKVPCAEMVRFVNTGTEATMGAIRLARAATGKNKIIKFEGSYHGAHDCVLVKSGSGAVGLPDSPGVPPESTRNTILIPFNDEKALENVITTQGHEIAAVIVEPVMGNIGCILPKNDYLKFLRRITADNGIILIFDEVITGFRLSRGGAQEFFGVTPDLVTLGKILGGGFPMGALAGKKELMEMIAPSGNVYQAGTFNGNPVSVTAGLAMLKELDNNVYSKLNKKGNMVRNGLNDIFNDNGFNCTVTGLSSMFQVYFTEKEVYDYATAKLADGEKFMSYFNELLKKGVFIPPSQFECCFISSMHDQDDITKTLEIMDSALKSIE